MPAPPTTAVLRPVPGVLATRLDSVQAFPRHAHDTYGIGRIRRGALMCPLHGARFELADGRCIGGAYPALRQFPVREAAGVVEVAVPTTPPGMDETPVDLPG